MERTMARLKQAGKSTRGARTLSLSLDSPPAHTCLSLTLCLFCLPQHPAVSSHRFGSVKLDSFVDKNPKDLFHGLHKVVEGAAVAALGEASPHAAVAPGQIDESLL